MRGCALSVLWGVVPHILGKERSGGVHFGEKEPGENRGWTGGRFPRWVSAEMLVMPAAENALVRPPVTQKKNAVHAAQPGCTKGWGQGGGGGGGGRGGPGGRLHGMVELHVDNVTWDPAAPQDGHGLRVGDEGDPEARPVGGHLRDRQAAAVAGSPAERCGSFGGWSRKRKQKSPGTELLFKTSSHTRHLAQDHPP